MLKDRAGPSQGQGCCATAEQEKCWRASCSKFLKRATRLQHDFEGLQLCLIKAGANQHHPVPPTGIWEIRTNYLGEKKSPFPAPHPLPRNSQSSISNILEGLWLQGTCLEGRTTENTSVPCKSSGPRKSNALFRPLKIPNQWKRWSLSFHQTQFLPCVLPRLV